MTIQLPKTRLFLTRQIQPIKQHQETPNHQIRPQIKTLLPKIRHLQNPIPQPPRMRLNRPQTQLPWDHLHQTKTLPLLFKMETRMWPLRLLLAHQPIPLMWPRLLSKRHQLQRLPPRPPKGTAVSSHHLGITQLELTGLLFHRIWHLKQVLSQKLSNEVVQILIIIFNI